MATTLSTVQQNLLSDIRKVNRQGHQAIIETGPYKGTNANTVKSLARRGLIRILPFPDGGGYYATAVADAKNQLIDLRPKLESEPDPAIQEVEIALDRPVVLKIGGKPVLKTMITFDQPPGYSDTGEANVLIDMCYDSDKGYMWDGWAEAKIQGALVAAEIDQVEAAEVKADKKVRG